jgi:predicted GNAT family N-acyltransferase
MRTLSIGIVETDTELAEVFAVRSKVFVEEQVVSGREEFDGEDSEALHIAARAVSRVVGVARVRFLTPAEAKLERMAVLEPYRRWGIGTRIVAFVVEDLKRRGVTKVVLHAQSQALEFYTACGFSVTGPKFYEAGIEHVPMERAL